MEGVKSLRFHLTLDRVEMNGRGVLVMKERFGGGVVIENSSGFGQGGLDRELRKIYVKWAADRW